MSFIHAFQSTEALWYRIRASCMGSVTFALQAAPGVGVAVDRRSLNAPTRLMRMSDLALRSPLSTVHILFCGRMTEMGLILYIAVPIPFPFLWVLDRLPKICLSRSTLARQTWFVSPSRSRRFLTCRSGLHRPHVARLHATKPNSTTPPPRSLLTTISASSI